MSSPTLEDRLAGLSPGARTLLTRRLRPHVKEHGTVGTPSEQLVVFYEVREGTAVTPGDLRRLLLDRLPRFMVPSRFVPLEALPVLPNGKVDRRALARRPQDQIATAAPVPGRAATAGTTEPEDDDAAARLLSVWRDVLGPSVGPEDDFFEAGGDSIVAMRLISRAATSGFKVTQAEFFRAPTVSGMLAAVRSHADTTATRLAVGSGCQPVPLTPIQHWFFEQAFDGADWWNQARLFEIPRDLDHGRLEAALNAVLEHHEALRLAFVRKAGGWQQHVQPLVTPVSIPRVEVTAGDRQAREDAVERETTALQSTMRLDSGLLLRALRVRFSGEPHATDLLYVVCHHLCLDLVSWDVLIEDLETCCEQLDSSAPVRLGSSTPFNEWSRALYTHAQAPALRRERSWWSTASRSVVPLLPRDFGEGGPNDEASAATVSLRLDHAPTARLLDHTRFGPRSGMSEYIVTALVHSLAAWSGGSKFRVGMEGHGRTDLAPGIDVSRTVGWFTTFWPVLFEVKKEESVADVLRTVREQFRAIPGQGMGYGLLRYLTADDGLTRELSSAPSPEVVFNYIGRGQPTRAGGQRFRPHAGRPGPSRDPRSRRPSLLEVNAMIVDDRLELACIYSRNIHQRETIQRLMSAVAGALILLAEAEPREGGRIASASDFPDAGLSQDELNTLIDPT